MVFTIEPGFVPSLEESRHQKIQEVTTWARLNAYPTNDLSLVCTRLILTKMMI
jgi:hypothetical protein